ncbi:TRAP transporter large permease subunit [Frigidibacter albus]|uniref:TRAP transporter large permease protein n=1 Tax=Frigidibacter albus TaxID=1465486 RepID=A0A6L8VDV0_9RHOB|nr:TRAP transporter large permease [Frigidibacter albus]MZQ87509.1 TRAP transporter large permease subunit [Frigidibacter albus]NBE29415.1 TRAP transporter large permease subunit [Frigidibacter albus]GGH45061.1 C4-dicarboxylate ABC transporter permease [Frigidibacter albus]
MSNLVIGLIGTGCLFGGILLGVNVMVVLGLVGAFGLAALVGFQGATALLSTVFFETTHSFHFSVIPLFLLMGFFAMRAGLGEDLFEATSRWMGNLRGGLAISTTIGAAAFGAASGSSVGTATVFTKLALPQMLDRGYDKSLASASIAIAGTLAVMIPPSALMVVYGILTDSSIGALLIAGFIPGIIFAVLLCLAIWLTVLRRPELAPIDSTKYTLREKLASLRLAGPLVLIIFCIVSGLYVGIFTPTEAGAVGAALTLLLAVIRHRGIKGVQINATLLETIRTSAMIFGILISALLFSKFLALSGLANAVGGYLTGLDVDPWVIVVLVSIIYLLLGMMMDAPALLAITLPITHPVMMDLGFDPVWFGVFVVLLVEIGAVTPPVGINCFVVQAASGGRVKLEEVFKGLVPFVLAGFVMLVLLYIFPQIALFLPSRM